jgi:serine/threonine protein kinase
LLASAGARHYFEREAEIIASLDHLNIVSIRGSGIIHHKYYFVMQYIDGQMFERYVGRQKLSFRERVILFGKSALPQTVLTRSALSTTISNSAAFSWTSAASPRAGFRACKGGRSE